MPSDIAMSAATTILKQRSAHAYINRLINSLNSRGSKITFYPETKSVYVRTIASEPATHFISESEYKKNFKGGGHASVPVIAVACPDKLFEKDNDYTLDALTGALKAQNTIYQTVLHEYIHVLDMRAGKVKKVQPIYRTGFDTKVNPKYLKTGWEIEAYAQNLFDEFTKFIQRTTIVHFDWPDTKQHFLNRNRRIAAFVNDVNPWYFKESEKIRRSTLKRLYALWPFVIRDALQKVIIPKINGMADDPDAFVKEMNLDPDLNKLLTQSNLQRSTADVNSHPDSYVRVQLSKVIYGAQNAQKTNGGNYHWKAGTMEVQAIVSSSTDRFGERVFVGPNGVIEIWFHRPESDKSSDVEYLVEQIKTPGSTINRELSRRLK